jgi:arginyl-tRNA synthetase
MHETIKLSIVNEITAIVHQTFAVTLEAEKAYASFSTPPKLEFGELAFACFILAKELKMNPNQLAQILAEKIEQHDLISKASVQGAYLNLFLTPEAYYQQTIEPIIEGGYFKRDLLANLKDQNVNTMIEYSQPNTHKEMHVGHMRNLCLGNALVRLHRYAKIPVISATFPGDVGTHVAKCLWYLNKYKSELTIPESRQGAFLGSIYTLAHHKLEDELGTEQEAINRAELTEILKQLEQKDGPYFQEWIKTRQWSIDMMEEVYRWADVEFDHWYFESDVDSESVKLVKKYYEQGLFVMDEGAIGIDLSQHKLGFCLLIKSDGNGLYATKDIELARKKFVDFNILKSVVLILYDVGNLILI